MAVAISGGPVLLDGCFVEGRAVLVEEGRIVAIVHEADISGSCERHDLDGKRLVPGFIDSQVNGGGGVLFNDCPTVEAIAAIGAAHAKFGTTGFLPTLISDDLDVVRRGIVAVDAAIAQGVPGVLGIHIEGPFLNVERKGIHDRAKIKQLDAEGFRTITALKSGQTVVTLAPECTTLEMIRRLVDAGAIVAAGHTDGTYEEITAALASGLSGFTHLFNAMSPLRARQPGTVGAALTDQNSWCGIIVDGHHIHPATLQIALKCKPIDKFMLVTDAMPSVGTEAKDFVLQGHQIKVNGGICVNADGTLAGSDLNMARAVRNCISLLGLSLAAALEMASSTPAQFLKQGSKRGRIEAGLQADLVVLDADLHVSECWIGGRRQLHF